MNIKNKPPIFVPPEHQEEIGALSKAALMDMVYDYATQATPENPMDEFRTRREIILLHRAKGVTPP